MRRLVLALDGLPALREAMGMTECGLLAAASLAELAGVSALRLGIAEELRPVSERDVSELRRTARHLELRMPPSQSLVKIALEAQPDRVILAAEAWDGKNVASPMDPRLNSPAVTSVIRSLEEAGIEVSALIHPELDAVKAAHGLGVRSVELFTGSIVDLPPAERGAELERLGDAARIASKLRMTEIRVAGGLDFHSTVEVLDAAPVASVVTAGRAVLTRAVLTGIDGAIRDFRGLL
jgi:pyridoxine 5-phosphate synthase